MRRGLILGCVGIALLWSIPAWAGGEGDVFVEESLRSLNERIKELEDQVSRLKQQPTAAAAPATAAAPMDQRLTDVDVIGFFGVAEFTVVIPVRG